MSEEYSPEYLQIVDDEGVEYNLEILDTIDYKDKTYMAFLPTDLDEDDPDYGMIILRVVEENGEEMYESVEDESEEQAVYEAFMRSLFDPDEED